jgi:hypothetical protein
MEQPQGPFMLATRLAAYIHRLVSSLISSAKPTTEDPVIKIGYDVSSAASGRTRILLTPKLSTLCVICVTTKISYYKVKYDQ